MIAIAARIVLVWAVAAAALAPSSAVAGVRIVAPRDRSTVIGPSAIELAVEVPAGRTVLRVDVLVDGQPLASLRAAPWRAAWDAGDGSRGHTIEVRLVLDDASVERAFAGTSPLEIQEHVDVALVNLYPVVRDRSGGYVTELTREDFVVLEDGVPQEIERFSTEHRPLRVGVVLDTSASMREQERIDNARKAALGFLGALEPEDQAFVVFFADRVRMVQDSTSDKRLLAAAIESAVAEGGTALHDAIWRSARRLEEFDGRRVMVLLSDGRDEAADGFGPGSLHTLEEATDQALRGEVMVFTIGLGRRLDQEFVREWRRASGAASGRPISQQEVLERVARATGGRLLVSPGPGTLRRAFNEIGEDLRAQYSLAYSSTNQAQDGKFRRVEVRVPGRTVEVVVRAGYYAPLAEPAPGP